MVYIFAFFGFMIGFGIGLGTANVLLRQISKEEILENKNIRMKYGAFIWLAGFLGGWLGVVIHNNTYL